MNRPSSLRQERQRQYSYMNQQEHDQQLKQQIEENKIRKQQENLQQFQENLAHYKNNKFGADESRGENPTYMADLQNLLRNKEREIEKMQMDLNESAGRSRQPVGVGFQGDMNDFARQAQQMNKANAGLGGGQFATFDRQNYSQRPPNDLFSEDFMKNIRAGPLGNMLPSNNDNSLQNIPTTQRNNENLNIINSIFGNNNPTSIQLGNNQSAFPQQMMPQSAIDSERDRRIQLRDLERKKRLEGIQGGGYGQVGNSNSALGLQGQPPNQVQTAVGGSRRDQIWQQKMMQRVSSQEGPRNPIMHAPQFNAPPNLLPPSQMASIQNLLPVNQSKDIQSNGDGQVRSSRIVHQINDAIKLDQSLNYMELMKLKEEAQRSPNLVQQNASKPPQAPTAIGNPLLGAEDDVQRRRRDAEKKQRQQDYQDYLAKQGSQLIQPQMIGIPPQPKQLQIISSNPADIQAQQPFYPLQHQPSLPLSTKSKHHNSSSLDNSNTNSSSVLQAAGGLNLLGLHQLKRDEDKASRQRQYREQLDVQAAQKKIEPQSLPGKNRKDLSDQVFAEILNNGNPNVGAGGISLHGYPQAQQQQYQMPTPPQLQQQKQVNVENNQQFFFKGQSDEERRKVEIDKKKEYGIQLQQQMAQQQQKSQSSESDSRRRRGGSIQPHQVTQQESAQQLQQQQQQFQQNRIFDYQQLPQQQNQYPPPQISFNGFAQQPAYQPYMPQQQLGSYPQGNPYSQMMQPQVPSYGVTPPSHSPNNLLQAHNNISSDPDAQQMQAQRQKQDDYRRDLEKQIQMREEHKKQHKAILDREKSVELQQIQQHQSQGRAPPPSASGPLGQFGGFSQAPAPQVPSSAGVISSDPSFLSGQQQQPNSFMRQRTDLTNNVSQQDDADRKSRQQQYQEELQKQVEDRKRQKEEEKRKIKEEEELIERKMHQQQQELVKREQNELQKEGRGPQKEEKKRNVRRDLFEPSSENVAAKFGPQQQQPKQQQQEEPKWEQPATQETRTFQPSQFNNQPPQFNNQPAQYNNQPPLQYQESRAQPVDYHQQNKRREDLYGNGQQSYNDQARFSFEPSQSNPYQGSSGLQPSFNLLPESSQYSSNYQNQPPLTTSGLRTNPPHHPPLDDEYQKMISMYQHAFQEIIEFKNQYMEEVMRMRERVIKEREEILEYEKVKQQQHLEIQNLRAVYERLGDMLQPETAQINPGVQQNLDNFLIKQQQDIMRMSQANANLSVQLNQQNHQYSNQIQIPQHPAYTQNQQVRVQPNPYAPHLQESPNMLEQSLSSDTKFVIVPNKIAQQQVQKQQNVGASTQMMQIWNENHILEPPAHLRQQQQQPSSTLAQLQALTQSIGQTLQGSSQFITGHQQTSGHEQQLVTSSKMIPRPTILGATSNTIPETIQELPPNQEEDNINSRLQSAAGLIKSERSQNQQQRMVVRPTVAGMKPSQDPIKEEDNDFNSRESSKSRGEGEDHHQSRHRQNIKHQDESSFNIGNDPDQSSYYDEPKPQVNTKQQLQTNPQPIYGSTTLDKNLDQIEGLLHKSPISITPQQQQQQQRAAQHPYLHINHGNSSIERPDVDNTIRQKSDLKSITSPMNSVQKTQQKTGERFHHAGVTGSSFYNATMQLQKEKEQTQQEEFQQQLLRIYGSNNLGSTVEVSNNPVEEVAALTHKLKGIKQTESNQQSFKPHGSQLMMKSQEEKDLMMETNINIADSINEDTQKQIVNNMAIIAQLNAQRQAQINQSRFSSSNLENQYSRRQSGVAPVITPASASGLSRQPEPNNSNDQRYLIADQYQDDVYDDEIEEDEAAGGDYPEEVEMNEQPKVQQTGSYVARDLHSTNLPAYMPNQQFQDTGDSKIDIWNDPDLVPPPVVLLSDRNYIEGDGYFQQPMMHGNHMTYEDEDNYQHFHAPPNNHRNAFMLPGSSNGNTNSLNGGTLKQLQLLSPPSQGDEEDKINIGTYNQDLINKDIKAQAAMIQESSKIVKSPLKRPPMSAKPQSSQAKSPQGVHSNHDITSQKNNNNFGIQPQPVSSALRMHQIPAPGTAGSQQNDYDGSISDRSMSKKEKDILDVMKQIQMAKDKTNSLLGNTDHFKFKFKKDSNPTSAEESAQRQVVSRQEPLKLKPQQINRGNGVGNTLASAGQQSSHRHQRSEAAANHVDSNDKDSQIMSNIDRLLMNLEDQKGKTGILNQSGLFDVPNSADVYHIGVEDEDEQYEQNKYEQPSVDPIAAMQNESNINLRNNQNPYQARPISGNHHQSNASQISQKHFPLNNVEGVEQLMDEVDRTYGAQPVRRDVSPKGLPTTSSQVILRPVSGKSNSNRYGGAASRGASRGESRSQSRTKEEQAYNNKSQQQQQQMYFDEDEDEIQ